MTLQFVDMARILHAVKLCNEAMQYSNTELAIVLLNI